MQDTQEVRNRRGVSRAFGIDTTLFYYYPDVTLETAEAIKTAVIQQGYPFYRAPSGAVIFPDIVDLGDSPDT